MCASNGGTVSLTDTDAKIAELEAKINQILSGAVAVKSAPTVNTETPAPAETVKETKQEEAAQEKSKPIAPPVISSAPEAEKTAEPTVPVLSGFEDGPFVDWPEIIEKIGEKDIVFYGLLSDTTASVKDGKLVDVMRADENYDALRSTSSISE